MQLFETMSVGLRLVAGGGLLWRLPRPPEAHPHEPCAIVIPARNEANVLPHLLDSLRGELRPGDQLIVVDDDSGDDTAGVASRGGATVLSAPPLPEGWTGKTWACATGARAATADTLVFLDADVTVAPGGLDRVLGAHHEGLLSIAPYHVTKRPYERLSLFFNLIGLMATNAFTPFGRRLRAAGAFGPCLVTSRADYDAVGGHAAVSAAVVEDVALARAYQAAGRSVVCLGGRGSMSIRMYPAGLGQLVEGWSKNMGGGASTTPLFSLLLVIAWVSLLIQAPWYGLVAYGLVVAELAWMARRVGRFGIVAVLLFPIPLLVFIGVFARSLYLTTVRHRVTWKGREIKPSA